MTAALAYEAMSDVSPNTAEHRTAAEDVAVAWAVMRFAHGRLATVEDRAAFEAAEGAMLRAAQELGYDEFAMRQLLRRLVQRNGPVRVEDQCLDDAPA